MDAPLDAKALAEQLGRRVAKRVSPLLLALGLAFAFFAGVTLVFRPPGATTTLALVDGLGAVALVVGAVLTRGGRLAPRAANATAAGALLFALVASLVAIKLLHLPAQTTNLLLVELMGSIILLSPAWTAAIVAASLLGWGAVAASEGFGEAWLNAAFALVVTSIMAITIQAVRVREARNMEQLTAANESKASALRRHAAELETANDSLEAFSYVIAHDLKEPIRGMRIYLEELRESMEDATPEDRADILARTMRTQANLERLVTGLLEWSRMTTTPLEPEPVDVAALLDEPTTRAIYDRVLDERRAKLLVDHNMPLVLGTPALVRQVLANLVLNAARHNLRPDAQVKVYAASDAPRGMVDIIVEDNGPGYPDAVLQRVSSLRDRPSTVKGGFGLAIARRAAQRLGGSLVLANRPDGHGAQAHVLFPRVDGRAAAMERRVRELV